MSTARIMVMGVGNILLSDEGLGVHFLKELEQEDLPPNVELLEGGTAGLELIHLIQEVDFLIIIDSVNAKADPGTLYRIRPDDIKIFPDMFQVSFHQVGLLEMLSLANILGNVPQTIIYGVQPKSLDWGMELTDEITAVLPRLKERILEEIVHLNSTSTFL